jgi:chromosome partitioning protein
MKIITVAAAKGGCGKSTITSALAVRAARESLRVALFDLNADQGNLTQWWMMRGEPLNPRLITDIENIPQDVKVLANEGFEWLLVDTPPLDMDIIEQAIAVATAVLIPVRCSIFDVNAIDPVTAMCRKHRKPFSFVLSAVDSKMQKLTDQTVAALVKDGPLAASRISYRMPYIQALVSGKTGAEISKELSGEVDGLWAEVVRLVASSPKAEVVPLRARK